MAILPLLLGDRLLFSFFGAFADPNRKIADKIHQRWPDADLIEIREPFHAFAIRFSDSVYSAGSENLPQAVTNALQEDLAHLQSHPTNLHVNLHTRNAIKSSRRDGARKNSLHGPL